MLYRERSLWERDRNYVIAAIVVIVAQFLWIAALLWQRARKRKAEAVLRESEKRLQIMAESTPSLIWMCDKDGKITYLNRRKVEFTGSGPKAGYGNTWHEYIHPDDLKGVLEMLSQALKTPASFSNQYRLRRLDGEYRWMFDVVSPRVNSASQIPAGRRRGKPGTPAGLSNSYFSEQRTLLATTRFSSCRPSRIHHLSCISAGDGRWQPVPSHLLAQLA